MVNDISVQPSYNAYAGREIAGKSAFSVPKSPLRTDSTETSPKSDATRETDSVELSRLYSQFFAGQTTPAPPPRLERAAAGDSLERNQDGAEQERTLAAEGEEEGTQASSESGDAEEEAGPGDATNTRGEPLDEADQRQLDELANRDREVRQHEQAHKAAGGQYAGAISYDYQQGPDGKRYAVGGEVSIDVSTEKDPAATSAKMRQVRAAAMAPAEPSGQDRQVAGDAMQQENEARQELSTERAAGNGSPRTEESGSEEGEAQDQAAAVDAASGDPVGETPRSGGQSPMARLSSPYGATALLGPGAARVAYGYRPIDIVA